MTNTLQGSGQDPHLRQWAWKAYMEQVQANLPYKAFPGRRRRGGACLLHPERGLLAGPNCPSRATGGYRADDLPDTCNYSHSSGIVAQTVEPDTTNPEHDRTGKPLEHLFTRLLPVAG